MKIHYQDTTAEEMHFAWFPVRAYLSKEEAYLKKDICRWRWAWWEYVHYAAVGTSYATWAIYWLLSEAKITPSKEEFS